MIGAIQRSHASLCGSSARGARPSAGTAAALRRAQHRNSLVAHGRRSPAARSTQGSQEQQQQQPPQQQPLRDLGPDAALILAWHAAQNRSLFAAHCFVDTVLAAYRRGCPCDDLELSLQLVGLQSPGSPKALGPQDVNIIVSWLLVIMLTAQEAGLPFKPYSNPAESADANSAAPEGDGEEAAAAGGVTRRHGQESRGLQGFVRAALMRYDSEGHTLARVTGLQAAARQQAASGAPGGGGGGGSDGGFESGGGGGYSQAAEVMQQYSRLALLTLEAAAAAGDPINRPLQQPASVSRPTAYARELLAGWAPGGSSESGEGEAGATDENANAAPGGGLQGAAQHMLITFMGAALGSPYSLQQFLAAAADAYSAGVAASEVMGALRDEEFHLAGGLLPVAAPAPGAAGGVTRQLFARWLSSAYCTYANLGAAFPAAASKPGWAWAGDGGGDEVEANAIAAFVAQTLARIEADEREAAAAGADADAPVEADPLAARIKANPEAAQQLAAASQALADELRERGTKAGRPVPQMVRVADPELAETSSALVAWRQQIGVVEGARALVLRELARGGGGGGGGE